MNSKKLKENNKGILEENNKSKNLLVTFGGINSGLSMPVFEFYNSIKEIHCDKIFIRDLFQAWYQFGCDSEFDSKQKILEYLKSKIDYGNYEKICFCGNSMGGFASIYFGTMLNVKSIIAFSPQTFINKFNRLIYFDFRWRKHISKIHSSDKKFAKTNLDLKSHLKSSNNYLSDIDIYYDGSVRLDKIHASRLNRIRGVRLINLAGGHAVVKKLRDKNRLTPIFQSKLN